MLIKVKLTNGEEAAFDPSCVKAVIGFQERGRNGDRPFCSVVLLNEHKSSKSSVTECPLCPCQQPLYLSVDAPASSVLTWMDKLKTCDFSCLP